MAAAYFQTPELALSEGEAKAVAQAVANVQRHYKIPGLRDDHAAIAQLAVVVGVTYGKRVPYLLNRKAASRAPAQATPMSAGSQNVGEQAADVAQTETWFAHAPHGAVQ